jgi:hypothetical protein
MPNGGDLVDVTVTGFDDLVAFLDTIPMQLTKATSDGMYRWGRAVMLTSRQRYVPVRKGDLIRSGRVNGPFQRGDSTVRLELDYTEPYAFDQHQNKYYKHPNGGQAHYLTQAVEDHQDELKQMVLDEFRKIH